MINYNVSLLSLLFVLCIANYGCVASGSKPRVISILPSGPVSGSSYRACVSMETVFSSDSEIILLAAWDVVSTSENRTIKWEILNNNGDKIFTKVLQGFTIKRNTSTSLKVPLNKEVKKGLIPGKLTINLYVDDALSKSKIINYEEKNAINQNNRHVVILPFIEICDYPEPWQQEVKTFFQNALAEATYIEIKRFFPLIKDHHAAKSKTEEYWKSNCFDIEECINSLTEEYGESIYIYGEAWIQRVDLDSSTLTIWIFDAKTGLKKRFHFNDRYLGSFYDLMQSMLKGVFYDKGLIKHLISL